MTEFKTRKKDKRVFPVNEGKEFHKTDDSQRFYPANPEKHIRSFKGTKFEMLRDEFNTKDEARKEANEYRLKTGNKVRVKKIYGTWGIWLEEGTFKSMSETNEQGKIHARDFGDADGDIVEDRYIVSNEGMKKGYWTIIDKTNGDHVRNGSINKDVMKAIASELNKENRAEIKESINKSKEPIRTITREEWNENKKHGYASITNGQRKILTYDPKYGTTLESVNVEKSASTKAVKSGKQTGKRAYVVERFGGKFTYYGVRVGKTEKAPLLKDFYSQEDAERYRDMVNGKIPKDPDWMYS